jgi:hypothetical protein
MALGRRAATGRDLALLEVLIQPDLWRCALPVEHVVRIWRALHVVPMHKRVPASAVWAAEFIAGCERRWWCHSSEA